MERLDAILGAKPRRTRAGRKLALRYDRRQARAEIIAALRDWEGLELVEVSR